MDLKIDSRWTLFLDRDGVINKRIFGDYIKSIQEFEFEEGAPEAIADLRSVFSRIIVVTNQQCIAKNIISECNLLEIHDYMRQKVKEKGGDFDQIYFAPELKTDIHHTRKPKPNMALEAKKDFPEINFEKSIMVGDTDTDIEFGKNLGMKTVLIDSREITKSKPDFHFESLAAFSKDILKNIKL